MRHFVLAVVGAISMTIIQPATARDLPLDRLFASPDLSGPTPRLPRLSPDGSLVTLLRNRAEDRDRYDLWAIDSSTGAARMLVDSAKIGSGGEISEEEKMRRTTGAASARPGWWRQHWVSRACYVGNLLSDFPPLW